MNAALMFVNNWEEQQQGLRAVGLTEKGEGRGGEEELRSQGVFKKLTGFDYFYDCS